MSFDLRSSPFVFRPSSFVLMLALAGIAFAIRLHNLGVSDLTFDESASAFISAKPYPEMIRYLLGAFHELPPGYYVLLRAWEFGAGRSEFALRYLSVALGVLGVALIYRLGRRGLGAGAGLIAALLLTAQPFHAYYSQDARMYTLMPVEAMLMVYLFDRLCSRPQLGWWLAFGAAGAASVLTHYVMGFFVAALCVYLLLHARAHRRILLPWFGGLAAAGAAMAMWLFSSRAWRLAWRILSDITWPAFVKRLPLARGMLADVAFGMHWRPPSEWLIVIAAFVVAGLLVSIFGHRWRTLRPGGVWLLPAWLIVPPLLLVITPERLEARYNAAIVPAICLLLALIVAWLWQWSKYTRLLAPVALGVLLYIQVTPLVPTMNVIKSDYGHVIDYLRRHARPGDALILNGPWQVYQLMYYPAPKELPAYWLPPSAPPGLDPAQARPELEKALATSKRIWVLPAAVEQADPKHFVAGWLNERAYLTSEHKELALYAVGNSPGGLTPLDPPVTWDDALALASVRWIRNQAAPGEPLLLDLDWRVLRAPQDGRSVVIDLADREGGVWHSTERVLGDVFAPSDQWQVGQHILMRVGLLVPLGTPPGEFEARVNVVGSSPSAGGAYVTIPGAAVLPCASGGTNPCADPVAGQDYTLYPTPPLRAVFGDGLALVGYQLGGLEFFQGNYASVTLYWRPERAPGENVVERTALVGRDGRVVSQVEAPPVAAWYPSLQWKPGQWLADLRIVPIPTKTPPGEYAFRVSLLAPDGRALPVTLNGAPLHGASKDWVDVGRIRISERPRQWRAGPISHPLSVTFGDKARLLGYDVTSQTRTGESQVALTLYWQALREMDEDYTVFTHVTSADGKLVGQKDSWPRGGDYATSIWKRGEVVKDEYLIPLSTDAGPGPCRVELGLYLAPNGPRLAAVANGSPLKDDTVIVPLDDNCLQ